MKKLLFLLLLPLLGFSQFNPVAFYEYGKSNGTVNTFIGAVAPAINTPALLAAKLGIGASRITLFSVSGNDIKCRITGTYEVKGFGNTDVNQITYFRDTGNVCIGIGINAFYNCTSLVEVSVPAATYILSSAFDQNFSGYNTLKKLYIPSVTTIGATVLNNDVFRSGNLGGGVIYANPSLQTINSGGVEGDLAYLATGNTIRYVTNFTKPSQITDLSAGVIYNSSAQLGFTAPSSTNTLDYYEVYVNGFYLKDISVTNKVATGLTANTFYSVYVVAVDILGNKSPISNNIGITTTNRTAVDADAIAYISASSNSTYQDIIDDLFTSLKSAGLYTKIQAMYPFLGTTATQQKWNAKNPLDTDAAFRLVFNGGGTFSNLGYQCNGTNAYAKTFYIPSVQQTANDAGFTFVNGTSNSDGATTAHIMGATDSVNTMRLCVTRTDYSIVFNMFNASITDTFSFDKRGIYSCSKLATSVSTAYRNGAVLKVGTGAGSPPSKEFYIGAFNNNGAVFGYTTQRIQLTALHTGLTAGEVTTLYGIIDTFENALGRKTW